jgi:hypothetical protein
MATVDWIFQILLGAMLGLIGQGVRVVGGLKKLHDTAQQEEKTFGQLFDLATLGVSLLIGAIAGALAMIGISGAAPTQLDRGTIVTLIASGYAGTDFIEAFINRYLPGGGGQNQNSGPSGKAADKAAADHPPVG